MTFGKICIGFVLVMALMPVVLQAANIPVEPYVEVTVATAGPLSVFCVPDGSGNPLTEAFNGVGQTVDGTISIILYDDILPWGNPVANYPAEDLWLQDLMGDLVACRNGSIADSSTDSAGQTSWTSPLMLGGHMEPVGGNQIATVISGWILLSPSLAELRVNSADLNGDGVVNLTDVHRFSLGYFGPYDYSFDFRWDGAVNLSDVALMASSIGANCP